MTWKVFPEKIKKLDWKSNKKQEWNTTAQKSGSGKIRTMCNQTLPTWTIETKFTMLNDEEYKILLGFVASVKGGFEPFLWLDPEDYRENGIAVTSGEDGIFQAVMRYGDWQEPVECIADLSVVYGGETLPVERLKIDGGKFQILDATGSPITGATKVLASYRYYWLVRFAGDGMTIERIFTGINRSKSFKLEVVRP